MQGMGGFMTRGRECLYIGYTLGDFSCIPFWNALLSSSKERERYIYIYIIYSN